MERILRNKEIFEIIPFDYSKPILFFPIRHHSPACSYHLLKAIDEYEPDCILVEGPKNADRLIPVLTNADTALPIAFYYFYKDTKKLISEEADDYKCYYPFLDSSPEYNALLTATKRHIDCGFIDLPFGEILINTAENKGIRTQREIQSYNDDYYLSQSRFFNLLCEKTGMRSFEEFWEKFFEIDGLYIDTEEFVSRMLSYCYLTRQNTPQEEMQSDGCLVRERFMAENILDAANTHQRVMVVTGGFHTYGLYSLVTSPLQTKKVKIHHFSDKIQNVYAMAYSFEAADALNGYASGMQNPGFYDKIWKKTKEKDISSAPLDDVYETTVLDTLLQCGKKCGKSKLLITMSDIASAVNLYSGLAALRDKKSAGLYELYDSVGSCFIKGERNLSSELPLKLLSEIATGSEIGKLCDTAEKIPLLNDFEQLCTKYKLKIDHIIEQKTELDIFSKPLHMEISRFFYRMSFLETGFAKRIKGADIINNTDRSRIREIWSYKRSTMTDSALIDYSAYGGTIEEACTVTAVRRLRNEQKCSDAAKMYVECFLMGIDVTENFADKMNDIIINDGDFFSIGKGIYYFNMLHSLGKMYRAEKPSTEYFLVKCFQKIIVMLPSMINVQTEYSDECIQICKMLYNLVSDDVLNSSREILTDTYQTMTESDHPEPVLYGALLGLLYGTDSSYKTKIKYAFEGYLKGTPEMQKQGAVFLRGLFSAARDIVLVGDEFIKITDSLIRSLSMEDFIEVLPELRLAFGYFTPSEIDSIAEKAAALYDRSGEEIKKSFEYDEQLYVTGLKLEKQILPETESEVIL